MLLRRTTLLAIFFLALLNCGEGRRGGGGYSSRRRWRPVASSGSRTRTTSSYKPKPSQFDKGGFAKYAKMGAAFYVARNLLPSVKFHPHLGISTSRRLHTHCHKCISINGSNPACESIPVNSTAKIGSCETTSSRPYCSVEYGVLSNNKRFVRRSCQERRCRSCKSDHLEAGSHSCHTFQCDMCNWNKCNGGHVLRVFSKDWKGCIPDPSKTSYTFDSKHNCGGGAAAIRSGYVLMFVFVFLAKLLFY